MSSIFGELPFGIGIRFVLCHFKGHINSGEVKEAHSDSTCEKPLPSRADSGKS